MTKRRLIIFEGADGSGKTSSAKLLCEKYPSDFELLNLPKRTVFSTPNMVPIKIKIEDQTSLTLYLEFLSILTDKLDPNVALVLDRSIYSNLAYGTDNSELTWEAIRLMHYQFDIDLIILDRDYVEEDFKDDLLERPRESFNKVIDWYKNYNGREKIFRTRLIYDGVFDNLKQMNLIDTIMHKT